MGNLVTVANTVWTDELFLRCPGATAGGVTQALENALREFCKQSGAWVVELWDKDTGNGDAPKPFNDGAAVAFYDFQAKLETARAAAGGSYTTGDPATALTQFHLLEEYNPWDILYVRGLSYFESYVWDANPSVATQQASSFICPAQTPHVRNMASTTGRPAVFKTYNERPGAIQLQPSLKGNVADLEGIVPWVSLGFPRTYIDDSIPVIFERMWYEHVLDGALKNLLSQQDKPYTNPILAKYHAMRFRNGISEARDMALRQFNTTERGWAFPAWA